MTNIVNIVATEFTSQGLGGKCHNSKSRLRRGVFLLFPGWIFLKIHFIFNYMSVSVCVFSCEKGFLKRSEALNPQNLELQVAVSYLMWVLGTVLGSSPKAVYDLKSRTISPVPHFWFM